MNFDGQGCKIFLSTFHYRGYKTTGGNTWRLEVCRGNTRLVTKVELGGLLLTGANSAVMTCNVYVQNEVLKVTIKL